jgi:lysophospholipase L1-like esterase
MKKTTLIFTLISALGTLAGVCGAPRTEQAAATPTDPSRHAKFLAQIQDGKGDFNFVLIGDSITDYWPGKGKDSYAAFLPWKPLNLGVSGEHTEHILFRIANGELDGIKPKVVMVMIGTNNLGHLGDEKPEWVAAGVKKIVETIRTKLPDSKILLLAIFPRSEKPTDPLRQRVAATNKLLAPLADNKKVFYMDIGEKFLDAEGSMKKELMPDVLHPNANGYQVWLDAVKPKLDELMK